MNLSEHHTADESATYLGASIAALQQRIATANAPGNLDALLARHILNGSPQLAWNVDPLTGSWLKANADRLENTGSIAALGYGIAFAPSVGIEIKPHIISGLRRLMKRDPFPGDRLSFLHSIRILFGIYLAAESVKTELPEALPWLQRILADSRLEPADRLHELAQRHVHATLTGEQIRLGNPEGMTDGSELAMAYWMIDRGTAYLPAPTIDARALQQLVMRAAVRINPLDLTVPQAAILLWAVNNIVVSSIDQIVLSSSHVGLVLRRFEAAMHRWRWDSDNVQHPIRWEIRSEREVQDILWIMLRSTFDDLVAEDTLPKFGHSSYRADFGLRRLGVLVEVKYAYKDADFKKIETEVMIDASAYLKNTNQYREIVVFIYDESASVEHHDVTRRALLDLEGVTDVIIASRPGVLPMPTRQANRPRRDASA